MVNRSTHTLTNLTLREMWSHLLIMFGNTLIMLLFLRYMDLLPMKYLDANIKSDWRESINEIMVVSMNQLRRKFHTICIYRVMSTWCPLSLCFLWNRERYYMLVRCDMHGPYMVHVKRLLVPLTKGYGVETNVFSCLK